MAQLKDSVVNGDLVVTDSTLTDSLQVTTVIAPVSSGSYNYGTGENGQALRSNGTTTYWGNLPTYQGMTESEIDDGTSTSNRTISPKNLKYAVREYETANYDNMKQLYYNGYTTMNILDCYGISSSTQKTSFDMEFNNEVLEGTYEFAAYIITLSSVTSCAVTFYNSDNSSVGTCQLTTNSASAHATVSLSDIAVKMTLSFASNTTISIDSFGLFPKFLWDYAYKYGIIIDMVQPSLPTPLITQKLNKLKSDYEDVKGENVFVGTCASAANSQTKAVTVSSDQNFELKTGVQIAVKFSASNTYSATASAPCKLNVNDTGAYNIWWTNTGTPTGTNTTAFGTANYYHYYTFDGTYWVWTGYSNHSNTTYSGMTVAEINAGTSTTNRLISPANLKTAVETYSPSYTKTEMDAIVDRIDDDISGLRTATAKIIDNEAKNLLSKNSFSQTGNWTTDVAVNLPPGEYVIYFGSLSSTDTDATKNQLGFFNDSYQSVVKNGAYPLVERGNGVYTEFELVETCTKFRIYSSNSAGHGDGDTVTATDVMICPKSYWDISNTYEPYCPTLPEIYAEQSKDTAALTNLIDTGSKNLMPTTSGQSVPPTRWIDIPVVLQPGTYRVFFGSLQSDDTGDTRCQACFLSGSTQVSNWLTIDRGTNVYSGVCAITAETTTFRLYPSTSYALSEGDTVTFSDCMICKECDWQISQTYVPYCPTNAELYAMRYVHDSVQVNLNDVTWTRSGGGLYYSNTITIPDSPIRLLYHATLSGFSNLRATDIITPACRRSGGWSGFVLYANTNSFLTSAWVTVSVSGLPN